MRDVEKEEREVGNKIEGLFRFSRILRFVLPLVPVVVT